MMLFSQAPGARSPGQNTAFSMMNQLSNNQSRPKTQTNKNSFMNVNDTPLNQEQMLLVDNYNN